MLDKTDRAMRSAGSSRGCGQPGIECRRIRLRKRDAPVLDRGRADSNAPQRIYGMAIFKARSKTGSLVNSSGKSDWSKRSVFQPVVVPLQ